MGYKSTIVSNMKKMNLLTVKIILRVLDLFGPLSKEVWKNFMELPKNCLTYI